jgi:hypothetical protein
MSNTFGKYCVTLAEHRVASYANSEITTLFRVVVVVLQFFV